MKRLAYFDSLRGIAIIGVVIVHVGIMTNLPGEAGKLTFFGQRGVQLFFIASAFTLTYSADKNGMNWVNFLIRRFFRIAPMFYLAIFLSFLLFACGLPSAFTYTSTLASILFINGLMPSTIAHGAIGGWTVAVEANFYMLFPLIYTRFKSLRSLIWLLIAVVIIVLSLSIQMALRNNTVPLNGYYMFLWFPIEMPVFILGMIAYRLLKLPVLQTISEMQRKIISLALMASAFTIFVFIFPSGNRNLYPASFGLFLVVISVALQPWRILINGVTQFIGRISYSVYLLHFYALILIEYLGHGFFKDSSHAPALRFGIAFVSVTLICWPVCYLTQRYIEAPGIRFAKRLTDYKKTFGLVTANANAVEL